jgi:hypothetical protein
MFIPSRNIGDKHIIRGVIHMKQGLFVRVDNLVEDLQISKPLAYKLMAEMNKELSGKGYIVVAGRVPRTYYYERFFGLRKVE